MNSTHIYRAWALWYLSPAYSHLCHTWRHNFLICVTKNQLIVLVRLWNMKNLSPMVPRTWLCICIILLKKKTRCEKIELSSRHRHLFCWILPYVILLLMKSWHFPLASDVILPYVREYQLLLRLFGFWYRLDNHLQNKKKTYNIRWIKAIFTELGLHNTPWFVNNDPPAIFAPSVSLRPAMRHFRFVCVFCNPCPLKKTPRPRAGAKHCRAKWNGRGKNCRGMIINRQGSSMDNNNEKLS